MKSEKDSGVNALSKATNSANIYGLYIGKKEPDGGNMKINNIIC